jgi:hypothetical protein
MNCIGTWTMNHKCHQLFSNCYQLLLPILLVPVFPFFHKKKTKKKQENIKKGRTRWNGYTIALNNPRATQRTRYTGNLT